MPLQQSARPRVSPLAAVAALLAALALPSFSGARDLQISFEPPVPTWRDAIVIAVSGPGPHCTPQLGEPELTFAGGWQLDIELIDECLIGPPSPDPFTVTTVLEAQPPRSITVRVHDVPDGGEVSTATLVVHPGADLELTVDQPASSNQPLRFSISGVGACPEAHVVSTGGGLVRVDYNGNCAILPPGEVVFTLPLEAGPLAPGEHEIVVFDHTDSASPPVPVVKRRVRVWDAARCVPSETALCLQGGRFRVEAQWTDFQSRSGAGRALPTAFDDTGLFWFFDPDNIELTIKVLNGCGVTGHYWVFVSSGSTVEYEVVVTDTANGLERSYDNALGMIPVLVPDSDAFATCP
jgi:hypothetical protein